MTNLDEKPFGDPGLDLSPSGPVLGNSRAGEVLDPDGPGEKTAAGDPQETDDPRKKEKNNGNGWRTAMAIFGVFSGDYSALSSLIGGGNANTAATPAPQEKPSEDKKTQTVASLFRGGKITG